MRRFIALFVTSLAFAAAWAGNAAADPVIAAAGDIACDPADASFNGGLGTATRCRQKYTSDILVAGGFDKVLDLGDSQYDSGALSDYLASYDPSWGRVKSLIRPIPGNHEYGTSGAGGYFDYFGAAAGPRPQGYYSFDVGSWHIVALNSNCTRVPGGCDAGSPQEQWLRADLAAHPSTCTLAFTHYPRFSSGTGGNNLSMQALWQALYNAGVDVGLAGHSHSYERFGPQDPNGIADSQFGIREFVVGTGGAFFTGIGGTPEPNSQVINNNTFGVLKLTLHAGSYDWQFVPEAGATFTDSGSGSCHGAPPQPPDTTSPTAPTNLTANAPGPQRVDLAWTAATDNVAVTDYDIYRDGSLIETTSGAATSYTDTTVAPVTTYSYHVKARDAAGNVSLASNTATVTTPPVGTDTFAAEADARVQEANPTTNFATSYLRADGGTDPDVESFLRVTVSGVQGAVTSAKLRLYAFNGSANGPAVYSTTNSWSETGITWSTRTARTSGATDDKGAVAVNTWVEYDVSSFVTGNGTYSFILATTSADAVDFNQREAASLRPELVVTTGAGGDTDPPETAIDSGPSGTVTTGAASFAFSADEPGSSFECRLDGAAFAPCTSPQAYSGLTDGPHTFEVRATDAAGNVDPSPASRTWTVEAPPPATLTFSAAADAGVEEATPTTNYGTSTILRAEGGSNPGVESYLLFTVTGVSGTVQSAKLRVYTPSGTANGPAVYSTSDTWSETGVTWSTRPARTSGATDDKGAVAVNTWVEYDVSSFVAGNGTYSFVLATSSSDGVEFYSREAAGLQPELIVTGG